MNEILRKDRMQPWVKEEAQKQLHELCFANISNSPVSTRLEAGCLDCRLKYKEIAASKLPFRPKRNEKFEFNGQKLGMKKFLYQKNIQLERRNALLEKENFDLKLKISKLKGE